MHNPHFWQPRALLIGVSLAAFLPAPCSAHAEEATSQGPSLVFFGTYTRGTPSQGIYVAEFDPARGTLQAERLAASTDNPSFLAIHPNGKWLYCVNEVSDFGGAAAKSGAVTAFAIDPVGKLTQLNQQSTRGTGPCHVSVDATGKWLLSANYGGGSVCVYPIGPDGQLGPLSSFVQHQGKSVHPRRQEAPHAHSIHLDPGNRFAFVADLGLDRVLSYHFDADRGKLAANPAGQGTLAPGSGPRHFAFHPDGRLAFANNEITCGVTAFRYDAARGALTVVDVASSLPAGTELNGNSTAECLVHPTGRYVYVSNRGHDSITVFAVDAGSGKLTYVANEPTKGKTPRNFVLDPSGQFLLAENQGSHTVEVFRLDAASGRLTHTGSSLPVPAPVCARFRPPAR